MATIMPVRTWRHLSRMARWDTKFYRADFKKWFEYDAVPFTSAGMAYFSGIDRNAFPEW